MQVCDRVARCAQEQAARLLRLALHRRDLVAALVATWPRDPGRRTEAEWAALRAVLPDGVGAAEVRNRTRQIRAYRDAHDGVLPADLTDLEEPPACAAQIVLAAADRQLAVLERTGERSARLRVKLPLTACPASARGWAWHVLPIALPPTVPAEAKLCSPTLRVVKGRGTHRSAVPDPDRPRARDRSCARVRLRLGAQYPADRRGRTADRGGPGGLGWAAAGLRHTARRGRTSQAGCPAAGLISRGRRRRTG
ncbi:hypothetical protein [Nonomuraea sp. SYSU D8015]|uniref:hypothetical protein n=1 Tax=Nonomuraea sp. SYSU D8015 TaxID=2593644 RepID=UPI0016608272|nr:hypothetical protein [Nonomuraea sp. SYSU D8015]